MVEPSKKVVILCEGQHECFLIQKLLEGQPFEYASKRKIQDTPRDGEIKIIKEFHRPRNDSKFLIKDEDGKDKCIKTFCELYTNCTPYNFVVILDADRNRTLRKFRKTAKDVTNMDILDKIDDFKFVTKDEKKHPVFFISPSLEDVVKGAVNENLDNGKQDEQKRKIEKFVEESNIPWIDPLYSALTSARSF